MRIFLAGAAGAIGTRLVPLLINAGFHVTGTTRSATKGEALRAAGVEPVVVDVYDGAALTRAVSAARPDLVMHQLTDLPPGLDPSLTAERNAAKCPYAATRSTFTRRGRARSLWQASPRWSG